MKFFHLITIFVAVLLTMISAVPITPSYLHGARMGSKYSLTKRLAISVSGKTTTQSSTNNSTVTAKITTAVKSLVPSTIFKEITTKKTAAGTTHSSSFSNYSGDGTYYDVGVGSCGFDNINSQMVAALNAPQMQNGENPNNNPQCGKAIKVTNPANNKSVVVKIVDTCPPCASGSVDLSPSAFANIADMSLGRIKINWSYV